uniref:Uncharacterized protein n=1 Tax=Fusarium oxysporum (strain Fo5176) TaxID=660025 RepID=A0A0D2XL13_FUSOF
MAANLVYLLWNLRYVAEYGGISWSEMAEVLKTMAFRIHQALAHYMA